VVVAAAHIQPDVCDTVLNLIHAADPATRDRSGSFELATIPSPRAGGDDATPGSPGGTRVARQAATTTPSDDVTVLRRLLMAEERARVAAEEKCATLTRRLEEEESTRKELQQLLLSLSSSIDQQVERKVRALAEKIQAGEMTIESFLAPQ